MTTIRVGGDDSDPRAWARRLRFREMAGERLSIAARAMWRAALRHQVDDDVEDEHQQQGREKPAAAAQR